MTQHYASHASPTAVCGADMVGKRNSRLDDDPAATTCPECNAWLDEFDAANNPPRDSGEAPMLDPNPEYMLADAVYDVRGFADDGDIDGHLMAAYDDRNGDPGYYDGWE